MVVIQPQMIPLPLPLLRLQSEFPLRLANMEKKDTLGQRHTMVPEVQLKSMKFCWVYESREDNKVLSLIFTAFMSREKYCSDDIIIHFFFLDGLHAIR